MVYCPKCGTENEDDAEFCKKCGEKIPKDKSKFEKHMDDFGNEVDQIGKKIENAFDNKTKKIDNWYDNTFGLIGPIISSIIGLIILIIIIKLLAFFSGGRGWMMGLSEFFDNYLLLFFAFFLFSNYTSYITRKYSSFRYASPLVAAVGFTIWFWVGIQVITIIGQGLEIEIIATIASIFELLLIPIALLILLGGYIGLMVSSKKQVDEKPKIKDEKDNAKVEDDLKEKFEEYRYKRLYRSGKDKLLGGICGGLGEYFKIDPVIIRLIFVVGLFVSFGTMILAYFILWIVVPRNPNHRWND